MKLQIWEFVNKGGPLMYPILLCSVFAAAVAIAKTLEYMRLRNDLSKGLLPDRAEFTKLLNGIKEGASEEEVTILLTKVMRDVDRGLSWLALSAMIAPLLGLTGTVMGMIRSFMVISESTSRVNPSMLAGGIWEALTTTAAGLLVAIPVHIIHHWLERQSEDIELSIKEIITKFSKGRDDGTEKKEI